jgi:hypothetical protein
MPLCGSSSGDSRSPRVRPDEAPAGSLSPLSGCPARKRNPSLRMAQAVDWPSGLLGTRRASAVPMTEQWLIWAAWCALTNSAPACPSTPLGIDRWPSISSHPPDDVESIRPRLEVDVDGEPLEADDQRTGGDDRAPPASLDPPLVAPDRDCDDRTDALWERATGMLDDDESIAPCDEEAGSPAPIEPRSEDDRATNFDESQS